MMNEKEIAARQKFIQEFSARVNDEVVYIEMTELRANQVALKAMELSLQSGAETLWGMIVVCQSSVYFYAPPKRLALMSLINVSSSEAQIEEEIFCFKNLQNLKFTLLQKKWYQFFSVDKIEFSFSKDGHQVNGEFSVSKNAVEILLKMRAALNL